jgi:hypothetical protein
VKEVSIEAEILIVGKLVVPVAVNVDNGALKGPKHSEYFVRAITPNVSSHYDDIESIFFLRA